MNFIKSLFLSKLNISFQNFSLFFNDCFVLNLFLTFKTFKIDNKDFIICVTSKDVNQALYLYKRKINMYSFIFHLLNSKYLQQKHILYFLMKLESNLYFNRDVVFLDVLKLIIYLLLVDNEV
jgi:hypothetical protein